MSRGFNSDVETIEQRRNMYRSPDKEEAWNSRNKEELIPSMQYEVMTSRANEVESGKEIAQEGRIKKSKIALVSVSRRKKNSNYPYLSKVFVQTQWPHLPNVGSLSQHLTHLDLLMRAENWRLSWWGFQKTLLQAWRADHVSLPCYHWNG